MSKRLLAREQPHHERAFEYYYALGEKRSYEKVAEEFSVSMSAVKLWGTSFGWKRRTKDRDIQIAREMASRTLSDEVNHRERNLKIVQMSLVRIAKAIVDGDVKMTMSDLDKLIRLESFLRDEPDSRQEIIIADLRNKSDEELREMIREEMEVFKELKVNDGDSADRKTDESNGTKDALDG